MELTLDFNSPVTSYENTCPLLLSTAYQDDPYLMVESFFSFDTLAGHKRRLKAWYQYALIENKAADFASNYLFVHNQFVQLLQASYLIGSRSLDYDATQRRAIGERSFSQWLIWVSGNQLESGEFPAGDFEIKLLSKPYREQPLQYVKDFATLSKIKQLRYGLLEWLYASLSASSSIVYLDKIFLFEQFAHMNKLIEALYLILTQKN